MTLALILPSKKKNLEWTRFRKGQMCLRKCLVGHVWTNGRAFDKGLRGSPECACGHGVESLQHMFWECEQWSHIRRTMLARVALLQDWHDLPQIFRDTGIVLQSMQLDEDTIQIVHMTYVEILLARASVLDDEETMIAKMLDGVLDKMEKIRRSMVRPKRRRTTGAGVGNAQPAKISASAVERREKQQRAAGKTDTGGRAHQFYDDGEYKRCRHCPVYANKIRYHHLLTTDCVADGGRWGAATRQKRENAINKAIIHSKAVAGHDLASIVY